MEGHAVKPDSSLEEANDLPSDSQVMLFDGWDYTPVRFPSPQDGPAGATDEPAPAEDGSAS